MLLNLLLKRIDDKMKILQKMRPLPASTVKKLKEQFSIEMTYNSNAIEGNKLTLKQTFLVVNEGLTVKGKSLKDHLEAKNHNDAVQFLDELIERDQRQTIGDTLIRSLQQLIVKASLARTVQKLVTSDISGRYQYHEFICSRPIYDALG